MAPPKVVVIGGGLAGLSSTMKLAELGATVDLISLTPVKRSHSVCAQGGINSCNDQTRQLGDDEWKHFDDTVYGGDFLNHQPPVQRDGVLGAESHRLDGPIGCSIQPHRRGVHRPTSIRWHPVQTHRIRRRHDRTAIVVRPRRTSPSSRSRRQSASRNSSSGISWDRFKTKPVAAAESVAQDMVSMEIKDFAADAVVVATGGCGLVYGRSTMSVFCTGGARSQSMFSSGRKIRQRRIHPSPPDGDSRVAINCG